MVLEQKKTHIAYRCQRCGCAATGYAGAFALSADMLRLKCPCGESEMTINATPDKKVRLSVPCLFCGQDHHFVISQSLFFGRELFLLNCPYTNIDICFIGEEEKVSEAILRNTEELNTLFEQMRAEGQTEAVAAEEEETDPNELLADAQIYDIIRFLVKELEADGGIRCPCHGGEYELAVTEGGIRVFCPQCGASHTFLADSIGAAQAFLSCESLELT